jgi:hypothetical protein
VLSLESHSRINKKRILDGGRDEDGQPVAVQVDYSDWWETERQLEESSSTPKSAADMTDEEFKALAEEVSGHWTGGDGLEYQRRIRAKWGQRGEPAKE